MKALKTTTKKASELKEGELAKIKNVYKNIHKINITGSIVTITSNSEVDYFLNINDLVKVGRY
jgi:hypothetical protein